MRTDELNEIGDHIHDLGVEDEHLVPSVGFNYQAVDDALGNAEPAEQVDFSDAASAIKSILLWICSPPDIKLVGARAASLLVLSRRKYREAQIRSLGAGTHAKFKRHDRRKDSA
jgi:hypothetical protein